MYWAIGNGLAAGQWPGNGTDLVTGGTPRYRLYETARRPHRRRRADRAELLGAVRGRDRPRAGVRRRRARSGRHDRPHRRDHRARATRPSGRAIFEAADCCCSIVQDVQAALADAHFRSARAVRACARQRGRRAHAGPAGADQRCVPGRAGRSRSRRRRSGHTTGRSRREGGRRSRVRSDRKPARSASCPTRCPAKARS